LSERLDVLGDVGMAISGVFVFVFILCLVVALILSVGVSKLKVIDPQIEMYEQENAVIEEQISAVVKQYQEYETGIFANAKTESSVTLVALYPDLKADALVKKQIEVYLENNEKIKELKEKKINGDVIRWWLYFGGGNDRT
ncbi:MAG: hypothetical protein J6D16_03470, partial [Clostridia bacterium]|nr:hypothetical protein [Clostridia bacterium]